MKISDLQEKLNLTLLTEPSDREVTGCYIGDLLSWVMGKAKSGDAWITIMNNINIVAVASLTDCACIILAEDVSLPDDVINKANTQDVTVLKSGLSAYELSVEIGKIL